MIKFQLKDNLQHTMTIYFMLIFLASLLVGVEFILDIQNDALKTTLLENFQSYNQHHITYDQVFKPINELRNKAMLMFAIIMCVMIIIFQMFIKNITEPLQHMIEISKKFAEGDLTKTITIYSKNELSELANIINDMSQNLQEITLLSKNVCSACNHFIDEANNILKQGSIPENITPFLHEIIALENDFWTLNEFLNYIDFQNIEQPS